MIILSILFFVTAILYASVGFGGGSTFLALLLISGVPYFIFPVIALSCNIIVVSGNCFNYIRAGNLNLRLLIPYLIGSIPLAFIGGSLPIEKWLFEILLFLVLTIAGILLLLKFRSYDDKEERYRKVPILISILIGDMSFVGPRPALFNQNDLIRLRNERGLQNIIPGLTGWAQINGRDELSIEEKVRYDLEYLELNFSNNV